MPEPTPHIIVRALREPKRVASRLIEMAVSLVFVSKPAQLLWAAWLKRRPAVAARLPRVALVAHVYYPDLFSEILDAHAALPEGTPLLVTAPEDRRAKIESLCPPGIDMRFYPSSNRGRDVGPFIGLLNRGALDEFEAVLKLHTKKSPHLILGGLRRRMIYLSLSGNRHNVLRILSQFVTTRAGLIGLRSLYRSRPSFWMANRDTVARLCSRMTPRIHPRLGFFEGTMFWVRIDALAPLRAASIAQDEFDQEAGQLDGTLHHAIERTFPLSVLAAQYELRDIQGLRLASPTDIFA